VPPGADRRGPAGDGVLKDQPDLFAPPAATDRKNFSILDAKIHTTRHGYALDTFLVLGTGQSPHYREMISLIEHDLAERLVRQAPLGPPTRGRISRQLKHFPITPEVHVRPDEKGFYHSVSITAGDRPGLLYAIACVFSKYHLDLHTAKIVTLGERARTCSW
jgi:[protein-PII] uridylyltransferase